MENPLAALAFAAAITGCETGTPLQEHPAAQDTEVAAGLKSFRKDCRALTAYWENGRSTVTIAPPDLQEIADKIEEIKMELRELEHEKISPKTDGLIKKKTDEMNRLKEELQRSWDQIVKSGGELQRGEEVNRSKTLAIRATIIRNRLKKLGLEVNGTLMCNVDLSRLYGSDPVNVGLTVKERD